VSQYRVGLDDVKYVVIIIIPPPPFKNLHVYLNAKVNRRSCPQAGLQIKEVPLQSIKNTMYMMKLGFCSLSCKWYHLQHFFERQSIWL
jgi:hypothetical protein